MIVAMQRRRSGFTIIEVIFTLGLLAIFAVLSAQFFVLCYHTSTDSDRRTESLQRMDAMIGQMRRDAWSADDIVVTGNALQMKGNPSTITWTYEPKTGMRRYNGLTNETRLWKKDVPVMHFEKSGPLVIAHVGDPSHDQTLTLTCQTALVKETP